MVRLLVFFALVGYAADVDARSVSLALVRDGPNDALDPFVERLARETRELTGDDVELSGDLENVPPFDRGAIVARLKRALADRSVDIVIALGPVSASAVATLELNKPVIAPIVVDVDLQGLLVEQNRARKKNLNLLVTPTTLESSLSGYARLLGTGRVAMILGPRTAAAASAGGQDSLIARARELGIDLTVVELDDTVEQTLSKLPAELDGVVFSPMFAVEPLAVRDLVAKLNGLRVKSFSAFGRRAVEAGVLLGYDQSRNLDRLARQCAIHIQQIRQGRAPETLPVALPNDSVELLLNPATAEAIGFYARWELLLEASPVGEFATGKAERETLRSAIARAVESNLTLAVANQAVVVGERSVDLTLSPLLPNIDGQLGARFIDDDRAGVGFGVNPEFASILSARLTQTLLAEPLWADRSIQERLQTGREAERRQVELDIAQLAALTYLDALLAEAQREVEEQNLRITRSNLDLARLRKRVGVGEPAEVPRWENQLATDQQRLIDAVARVRRARIVLNRVLNLPLDQEVLLADAAVGKDAFGGFEPIFDLLERPSSMARFVDFMVQESQSRSPELARLDAAIEAQERRVSSKNRAFWVPELGLAASVDWRYWKEGVGSEELEIEGLPPGFELTVPDDLDWQVGAFLSYPLFEGAGRFYERDREAEEAMRLAFERRERAQRIEERMREVLIAASASFPSIGLARAGADAASESLRITTEAYASGTAPLLRLIDAQATYLRAETLAVGAVFQFLRDFVDVQRAAGDLSVLTDDAARAQWLERFTAEVQNAP